MASIRHLLSTIKPNPSELELKNNFLPTQSDIALLDKNTSHHTLHTRLGFMLMLKSISA